MKVERTIEIRAPVRRVYTTVRNFDLLTIWFPGMREVIKLEEGKFSFDSILGKGVISIIEELKDERLMYSMEGLAFKETAYIFRSKGEMTEVTLWNEYKDNKGLELHEKAIDYMLNAIKRFMEFLEEGGSPEEFDKTQVVATH